MTDSFGARLRRERERRHITLAQIAASTKIKASLFESLERDDVSRWPAGIFRRSFVRAYAGAVGLDPEQVCREFVDHFPDSPDGATTAPRQNTAERSRRPTALPRPAAAWEHREIQSALDPDVESGLRLTFADAVPPAAEVRGGDRPGPDAGDLAPESRLGALAVDLGIVFVIALTAFVILGAFWMPLAVTSLTYYCGSTVLLGRTMGVSLFAPTLSTRESEPAASPSVIPLERALDMREYLERDAFNAPDANEAPPIGVPYPALRPPVDIESRRARA